MIGFGIVTVPDSTKNARPAFVGVQGEVGPINFDRTSRLDRRQTLSENALAGISLFAGRFSAFRDLVWANIHAGKGTATRDFRIGGS